MTTHVPEPAAGFVRVVNDRDPVAFIALFTEDAVVDDAGREIRGREAIREWAAHDIFAANVTLEVRDVSGTDGDATVTGKVDGTFDRIGLPDPLIMTFRVVSERGKIGGLTCRLAGN
jgi:ketosteroid isomerase-like protein